ncbi:MAG TPA: radical SAM protein, partial [Caulifigura sp.]|nr:radical SAM protein [Caulifigura sp.]
MNGPLRVVVLKPGKYTRDGYVERFRRGFMPNSTVPHIRSMTPAAIGRVPLESHSIDEYVHTDLRYLSLLRREAGGRTLVALVGVQSHQFHRALDLAAHARKRDCLVVMGGPHVMTCDTSAMHGRGVSFALCEAELVWDEILDDAARGELKAIYGRERRWQQELRSPAIVPPSKRDLARYVIPMLGLYPARGCPFVCNFCSVTKIAGRKIRSQSVDVTLASLRAAKAAGVRMIMFTSDNFNKYPDAPALLRAIVDEKLNLEFFVQCDTQIARQPELVELLAKAGCFQMFVGVESFDRQTLLAARKGQNRPATYHEIVRLCREHHIGAHFSNIIGFPQDTERSIRDHLAELRAMGPNCGSFYILCPIPGTEQYDDFLAEGLVTERNLDRFDTTCLTWRHPHLSAEQLQTLLFECYRKLFSMGHFVRNLRDLNFRHPAVFRLALETIGKTAFNRFAAW